MKAPTLVGTVGTGAVAQLRPMVEADLDACLPVWSEAFADSRRRARLPALPQTAATQERECRRVRHLLRTDPEGSWVATTGDRVVGLVQAIRRDDLWVLSLLAVAVGAQGRGVGRSLLDRALGSRRASDTGLIMSSFEPHAVRLYEQADFCARPTLSAVGRVSALARQVPGGVRQGATDDLQMAAAVDRRIRGAAHGPDLVHLLQDGCRFLVVEGRGYAVVGDDGPLILAADDDDTARRLLSAALAGAEGRVAVHWLTADQGWAVDVVVAAGLALRPAGGLMVLGAPGPLAPYLPSGPFG